MRPLFPWCPPPASLSLEPGSVHLWRLRLQIDSSPLHLLRLLSTDEQARAERLRIAEKARDFILGRARLRQVLARYVNRAPADIAFTYGPQGKPALTADCGGALHFNLAHSGGWMLLAVANAGPVGVDLERIDPALDFAPLARRFFSSAERDVLDKAPNSRQRRTFYRLWTRKEASLKTRGGGFSGTVGEEIPEAGWRPGNLFVGRDYVAALAVAGGEVKTVRRWTWTGGELEN
jgi:4'-phosphopantetheinyl transferase